MTDRDASQAGDIDSATGRLDSWKEIAAYLRRDVRTVQRWHATAGLPVHRHVDVRRRGVFAFRAELDAWANQSRVDSAGQTGFDTEVGVRPVASRAWWWWFAAGVLITTPLVAGVWKVHGGPRTAVRPTDRIPVIVAAFANRTGDPTLDDSLHFVLERELSASNLVSVVPPPRVQDLLLLMRRPTETRVTRDIAREVALRDGTVRAIVTGAVDVDGAGYLLTVDLVDVKSGATLASRNAAAASRSQLLGTVRHLSDWTRHVLGETASTLPAGVPPPQVTTRSVTALNLYAQAQDALSRDRQQLARVLLEGALREDPSFALAHSWLAVVLMNGPDYRSVTAVVKEHEERALELSASASPRERFQIEGSYYDSRGEADKALAAWEALSKIDPDNAIAHHFLSVLYYRQGKISDALRETERVTALRPNDFSLLTFAAQSYMLWVGDLDRARPYAQRAAAAWAAQRSAFGSDLWRLNLPPETSRRAAWVLMFPAYERWHAGDVGGTLREVRRVLETDPLPAPIDRDALLTLGIAFDMSAGRLRDARQLADRMSQDRVRELHLAVLADAIDDIPALRRHMMRIPIDGEERALRFIRAGLYREAEQVMARHAGDEGFLKTAQGELALRRGHLPEAVEDLRRGVEARTSTLSDRYLGAESLADALLRLQQPAGALQVLQAAAAAEPQYTRTGPSAAFWLRVLDRLSRTYRDLGRTAEADAVDTRLRRLLEFADPDHPLAIRLAHRSRESERSAGR